MSDKLSALSREQKLILLEALEEKRRRELTAKPKYKPNSGQLPVHLSTKNYRFVFSANGAGKTALLVNEIHAAATGTNPWQNKKTHVPAKIIVVVDNSSKVDEVILPEYRRWHDLPSDWLKRGNKNYTSKILFDNGSVVSFYSAEAEPQTFEGVQSTHVFIDEPLRRNLYTAVRRSLRISNRPGKLLFCGTALDQAWLLKEIFEPWSRGENPDVECFKVGITANAANLREGFIEEFSRGLTEEEKEVRLRGGFFNSAGQALANVWSRDTHLIPAGRLQWPAEWPVVIGIDPHPVKPHVAIMLGTDPDERRIVLKELRLKKPAADFARAILEWAEGYKIFDIVVDSLGNTEGTGNDGFSTFIDVLKKNGVHCRATRFDDKSHADLIDRLQSGLLVPKDKDNYGNQIPKIRVVSDCKGLISDIETAGWQRNRMTGEYLPKLDTSSKDFLSAFGYALAAAAPHDVRSRQPFYMNKSKYRGISLRSERQLRNRPSLRKTRLQSNDD